MRAPEHIETTRLVWRKPTQADAETIFTRYSKGSEGVSSMPPDQPRSVPRDILAGFLAICTVLGISIHQRIVGADLRLVFLLTDTTFYVAGFARGRSRPVNIWLKGLLISSPGVLGTAALIMNDGLHRLLVPAAITITATLATVSGAQTRRFWSSARRRALFLASVTAALGVVAFFSVPALVAYSSLKIARRSVQPFTMSPSDGSTVASRDFRGRVVVLAFWTSWCLPCVSELPELHVVYTRFAHNPQVVFWAVDANWGGETPEKARTFLARRKLSLPWAFDSGGAARALGVDSLPTIIILDREGNVSMTHFGYDASERLNAHLSDRIEQLLNHPAPAK